MNASHAVGKHEEDAVFTVLRNAQEAITRFGQDKVINGTIGAIYDDQEQFVTLSKVNEMFFNLRPEEVMNYAPISGLPDFLNASIDVTLGQGRPEAFVKAVATPGGTGGVRHVFYNYAEQGDKILIPDWYWGPYSTIAAEHLRRVQTYALFDSDYQFHIQSIIDGLRSLLQLQDSVVLVINSPAHNPTGYSLSLSHWKQLLAEITTCVKGTHKRVILLIDIAYIDYAGDPAQAREFMALFGGLPENLLVTIAFSMSKSFLCYGLRSGALIGISASKALAEEFFNTNAYSNRGVWSNGTRGAQRLLAEIVKNKDMLDLIEMEREGLRHLIENRARIFLEEAKASGLNICPYSAGFFITVPSEQPAKVAAKLALDNIYVVPLSKGIRFAICSIPTKKIPGLASKTKKALDQ
jgi:aromatic-amino-acid transaminase